MVLLAKAYPSLSANKVLDLHRNATGSKSPSKRSRNTTGGPSRHSFITCVIGAKGFDLMSLAPILSQHLSQQGARLHVESYRLAYGGLYVTTTAVPSLTDLQSFESLLRARIPEGSQVECEVFSSRSFLRILAAPFLLSDGSALTPDCAMRSLSSSAHSALIQLAAPPRVIRDTRRSDSCTIYFDIWDSQAGSCSKSLDRRSLLVEGSPCIIRTAQLHIGVPFCSHCC